MASVGSGHTRSHTRIKLVLARRALGKYGSMFGCVPNSKFLARAAYCSAVAKGSETAANRKNLHSDVGLAQDIIEKGLKLLGNLATLPSYLQLYATAIV